MSAPGPDVRPASHFAEAFCIYIGLTLARVVLYGFHVTGMPLSLAWLLEKEISPDRGPRRLVLAGILHWLCRGLLASVPEHKGAHIMSDHLVLGASIVAICMAEVVLGWIDLRRLIASCKPEGFRLLCLATGAPCTPCTPHSPNLPVMWAATALQCSMFSQGGWSIIGHDAIIHMLQGCCSVAC